MAKARRKACSNTRVSPRQLWDMLHQKFKDGNIDPHEFDCLGPKFQTDLNKVDFSFENFGFDHSNEDVGEPSESLAFLSVRQSLGYRKFWTRSPLTCFSFIGWYAGGDWEWPINFLMYLDKDGKTFRAYIPKEGNAWNYDSKAAIGNDEDADNEFLKKWISKNRPDLINPNPDYFHETSDAEVMTDYTKMRHEIMFRFEAS